jgi:hypothetical protein
VEAGLGALRCAGAELLGDFYFEKIKILLPKNASDEKIFLRFEKIFWGVNFGETKRGYSLKAPCKGVLNVLYPPKEVQNF